MILKAVEIKFQVPQEVPEARVVLFNIAIKQKSAFSDSTEMRDQLRLA